MFKNAVFIAAFCAFFAQKGTTQIFVDTLNINDRAEVEFIEIQFIGWRDRVEVDWGQPRTNRGLLNSSRLTDAAGKALEIQSPVQALNFFFKNGWEPALTDRAVPSEGKMLLRRRKLTR